MFILWSIYQACEDTVTVSVCFEARRPETLTVIHQ